MKQFSFALSALAFALSAQAVRAEAPHSMNIEDLLTLPGVGRKTANLIVGDVYGKESVVVDTHMIRIANRLGLVATKDPKQIEFALKKIIPPDMGSDFCHRIVLFGRDICPARSPKCERCPLADGTCRRVERLGTPLYGNAETESRPGGRGQRPCIRRAAFCRGTDL